MINLLQIIQIYKYKKRQMDSKEWTQSLLLDVYLLSQSFYICSIKKKKIVFVSCLIAL